jgi:hypothetical protein
MSTQRIVTTNLVRWSGLISLLAGVLYAVGALLHPTGEGLTAVTSSSWVPAHLVYWISAVLMHFSLIGLYALLAEQTGWIGLLSFSLAFIGTSVVSSILLYVSTVLPLIASDAPTIFDQASTGPTFLAPIFLLGFGLGWILIGSLIMRVSLLPSWSGLLLIIGVTLFLLSEMVPSEVTLAHILVTVGDIIFGLGLAWIGYALWSEKRDIVRYGENATSVSAT